MTTTDDDLHRNLRPGRQRLFLALAAAATVPGLALRLTGASGADWLLAVAFGMAIVGAAFMLSWAAEVAQLDIPAGLAVAALALIAVLPEYAVDMVFTLQGGNAFERSGRACRPIGGGGGESPCSLALANMTGGNRLLIGVGWSMVVFLAWWGWRRRREPSRGQRVTLERSHAVELAYLTIATLYSLTLPLKRSITLLDAAVLVSIFVLYALRLARAPAEEPHLVGPARWIGGFATPRRRATVVGLFLVAAAVIVACAERFAHALVGTGQALGVSEFLLVQWLAPLASEAPELLVAGLYAWRLNTNAALATLVSSKVNQWTLLVGTLPIAFAAASGGVHGLPIDALQREELFLTAAQSLFAVAVLADLSMSTREAGWLFGLFLVQFVAGAVGPEAIHDDVRLVTALVYLALGAVLLGRKRRTMLGLLRDGLRPTTGRAAGSS